MTIWLMNDIGTWRMWRNRVDPWVIAALRVACDRGEGGSYAEMVVL